MWLSPTWACKNIREMIGKKDREILSHEGGHWCHSSLLASVMRYTQRAEWLLSTNVQSPPSRDNIHVPDSPVVHSSRACEKGDPGETNWGFEHLQLLYIYTNRKNSVCHSKQKSYMMSTHVEVLLNVYTNTRRILQMNIASSLGSLLIQPCPGSPLEH